MPNDYLIAGLLSPTASYNVPTRLRLSWRSAELSKALGLLTAPGLRIRSNPSATVSPSVGKTNDRLAVAMFV